MNFESSSNHLSSYSAIHPSPLLVLQQVELDYHEALTLHDVPFSDDFLSVEGFAADPFPILSPQVPPPAGPRNVRPFVHSHFGEPQRTSRSSPHVIHPAVAPQSSFDGTYSLQTHPSAWCPGPSIALYGGGEQAAALAGGQNMAVAVPSTSGTMPIAIMPPAAAPSFFSTHVTVPTSGSPAGARTPVVRTWDAVTATTSGASACAARQTVPTPFCRCNLRAYPFVRVDSFEWVRPDVMKMIVWYNWSLDAEAEVRQPVPMPFCRCNLRAYPFVRIEDRIEWVRPDLMKMTVWYNWSLNAEAEAHESWEPCRG
ncbi:hypothetical protein BJY52DRAFT_1184080 [Lactarius psammicola]|nr:hypothetical protein BJY52DRAFT_1184080 [Lactarius psammicola]